MRDFSKNKALTALLEAAKIEPKDVIGWKDCEDCFVVVTNDGQKRTLREEDFEEDEPESEEIPAEAEEVKTDTPEETKEPEVEADEAKADTPEEPTTKKGGILGRRKAK